MPVFYFILMGLFSWRITHLLIDDTIMERPVNWIYKISRSNKYINKLLTCYYCLGFWVALSTYVLNMTLTDTLQVNSFFEHIVLIGALAAFPPLIQEFIPE